MKIRLLHPAGRRGRPAGEPLRASKKAPSIVRLWHAYGLKPHWQESFQLSSDPFFVEKGRDIVGCYLNPPEATRAIVLGVDEKSQVRHWTAASPFCRCAQGSPSGARMMTIGTERPRSLRPCLSPAAR